MHRLGARGAVMSGAMLTVEAAAQRLGLCHWTIRKWLRNGRLPYHRVGSRAIRIAADDLDRLLAAGRHEAHEALALDGVRPSDLDDDDGGADAEQ